ncbi:hypothetical protein ACH4UM_02715 [Streptomyces sp. NPDC020801]|uniref:hypothetical protein n=1 Tax=Streptomyces sp. NPDC020801 TaxID=3365093 RepID=UPI0037AC1070
MTPHRLLPAGMSQLPLPWSDLTRERSQRLGALEHTEANERAAVDALDAALSAPHTPAKGLWNDESWELFDRVRRDTAHRLARTMPTFGEFTREGVAAVIEEWARTAEPAVPGWWVQEQMDPIAGTLARCALSDWADDVLRWLRQEPYDTAGVAAVAERCIDSGLAPREAVDLLHALGAPDGERALLRAVRSTRVSEYNRSWAREALVGLRRPGYEARAQQPARGEAPLLPPAVRDLPYSWGTGFQWPADLPETEENVARARALLQALAPAGRLPEPVPDPVWSGDEDEESPSWLEVRKVMWELMPYACHVTRERMTEAMLECALLGIPGVPQEPDGEEAARFVRRWVTWIGGWIAGEVFTWLGMYVDDDALVTPWAMELAERYARCGLAAERAVSMLRWHDTVTPSREALTRIAADETLPPHVREQAALL